MKVDVHKAFDSVHWGFIRELLDSLKFPTQFTKWVMACISSVSYTILVNGVQGEAFEGGRGLKQGDPLSPLLFVLAIDYFSRLMQHASCQPGFALHPHCRPLGLTHLMFADNVMIFSKANPTSISYISSALHVFH